MFKNILYRLGWINLLLYPYIYEFYTWKRKKTWRSFKKLNSINPQSFNSAEIISSLDQQKNQLEIENNKLEIKYDELQQNYQKLKSKIDELNSQKKQK